MAFHPEDRVVASCSEDKSIKLWNLDDGGLISTMSGGKQINSVAFSPDGSLVAAGDGGYREAGTIRLYDAATGDPFGSPLNVGSRVYSVHFSPDGHTVAAGCSNGTVQIIDVATAEVKRPLRGHSAGSRLLQLS